MTRANPYTGRVDALPREEFELLRSAVAERGCREECGFGTFAEAAGLYRPHPPCPACGRESPARDGASASGLRRFRCPACGLRFNSLTGTVLEYAKKDLPAWVEFVRLMCFNVPLDAAAGICRISHQTAWEWRRRIFAAVDGCQDRIVLRDRVWIDETYVGDADIMRGGGAGKRGLSGQKLCVAVAIDVHKNPVAAVCGHGRPSAGRMREAMLPHLARGSVVVHDMEKAHRSLVRAAGCTDEAYRADVRDPVYLERMAMVNNLCSWIKRYLRRFPGMGPGNLQSYLNWYVYLLRVNRAQDRWPRVERVVRHLLMTVAHYRSPRA